MLVVAAAALAWYLLRPNAHRAIAPALAPAPAASAPGAAASMPPSPFADAPPVAGPDRSMLEERAARNAAIVAAQSPDPRLAREAFLDALERFDDLRLGGATQKELEDVARVIDAGIDARIDRTEMSLADAIELMTQLSYVLEPDPVRRQLLLEQWREERRAAEGPAAR